MTPEKGNTGDRVSGHFCRHPGPSRTYRLDANCQAFPLARRNSSRNSSTGGIAEPLGFDIVIIAARTVGAVIAQFRRRLSRDFAALPASVRSGARVANRARRNSAAGANERIGRHDTHHVPPISRASSGGAVRTELRRAKQKMPGDASSLCIGCVQRNPGNSLPRRHMPLPVHIQYSHLRYCSRFLTAT